MALAWCYWRGFCFCLSELPYRIQQLFFAAFQRVLCSPSLLPRRSISSANCKLQSGRPPVAAKCQRLLHHLFQEYMHGDDGHPCPTVLLFQAIHMCSLISSDINLKSLCLLSVHWSSRSACDRCSCQPFYSFFHLSSSILADIRSL